MISSPIYKILLSSDLPVPASLGLVAKFSKRQKYLSKNINVAVAVTHSPNSFAPIETGTIRLQSEELWYRRDFSGNKTTFLWGLFTFTDY